MVAMGRIPILAHQSFLECRKITPALQRYTAGAYDAAVQDLSYQQTQSDEVEDLLQLVAHVKRCHPDTEAVSSGAIASDYQRLRVEHVSSLSHLCSAPFQRHQV